MLNGPDQWNQHKIGKEHKENIKNKNKPAVTSQNEPDREQEHSDGQTFTSQKRGGGGGGSGGGGGGGSGGAGIL